MISSLQNELVKRVVRLRDRRDRQREGVFVIEGEKEFLCATANGIAIETVLYCGELLGGNERLKTAEGVEGYAGELGGGAKAVAVSERVYEKIAYRETVGGLVAVARTPVRDIKDAALSDRPFVVVVEGVEKPGNLGALLRTADGAGVEAVIVCGEAVELYNPNVVRSSVGAVFAVACFACSSDEARAWLRGRGIGVVVATPGAKDRYTEIDYTGPVALVLGSEHEGVDAGWLGAEAVQVRIPMAGQMDSLNVAASGAVLMYEVARQRREDGAGERDRGVLV